MIRASGFQFPDTACTIAVYCTPRASCSGHYNTIPLPTPTVTESQSNLNGPSSFPFHFSGF